MRLFLQRHRHAAIFAAFVLGYVVLLAVRGNDCSSCLVGTMQPALFFEDFPELGEPDTTEAPTVIEFPPPAEAPTALNPRS